MSSPPPRALVADHRPAHARHGYPDHVRQAVVRYASPLVAAGRSVASLAAEVGLAPPTLGRWLAADRPDEPSGFVPVLVDDRPPAWPTGFPTATLTLVTPGGFRVEGLQLDALLVLLRGLR